MGRSALTGPSAAHLAAEARQSSCGVRHEDFELFTFDVCFSPADLPSVALEHVEDLDIITCSVSLDSNYSGAIVVRQSGKVLIKNILQLLHNKSFRATKWWKINMRQRLEMFTLH